MVLSLESRHCCGVSGRIVDNASVVNAIIWEFFCRKPKALAMDHLAPLNGLP
jgi:hypothetical protein